MSFLSRSSETEIKSIAYLNTCGCAEAQVAVIKRRRTHGEASGDKASD